jgi:NAD dependent epimerase/dehydratase family
VANECRVASATLTAASSGPIPKAPGSAGGYLPYSNAAGADPEGRIGEWHSPETHAIPIALEAALSRRPYFQIAGTDYETRDGSCIRDFVHVLDLADAHTRAIEYLLNDGTSQALNLGTGRGTAVRELTDAVRQVVGRSFDVRYGPRREGDSPAMVADNALALRTIGWSPSTIFGRSSRRPGTGTQITFQSNQQPILAACGWMPRRPAQRLFEIRIFVVLCSGLTVGLRSGVRRCELGCVINGSSLIWFLRGQGKHRNES